jgi:hypothetical protein
MMLNLNTWGAYLFFSVCTFVSIAWAFFFFPELKGRSIESMDRLFDKSAVTMRSRAYPTQEEKTLVLDLDKNLDAGNAVVENVESKM